MKIMLILIAITLFGCSTDSDKLNKNDLSKNNLKGNIKSIKSNVYLAEENFGNLQKGERTYSDDENGYNTLTQYNRQGFILEKSQFGSEGEKVYISDKYNYDSNGTLIEVIELINNKEPLIYTSKYLYNDKNQVTEISKYSGAIELWNKTKFNYDDDGNLITKMGYHSDGTLGDKTEYKFEDNKIIERRFHFYYGSEKSTQTTYYKYNDDDLLIKEYTPKSNTNRYYKYDDNGNLIEEGYNTRVSKLKYRYVNDNLGNWIKKTEYENDIPKYIIEREIEYYNK